MSIILAWSKKNTDASLVKYEIYRSVDKATVYATPNLLVSITDKNQVAYTDTTTLANTPYWYGIRNVTVTGDADSSPILLVDCTNPGMGGVTPFIGDYQDGYIESYLNDMAFTAAAHKILLDQIYKNYPDTSVDFTYGPISDVVGEGYSVNKFWKDGKLIFAPNHPQLALKNNAITMAIANTNIINPLVAAKPRVEIDGVLYEFRIMNSDEILKYILSGSKRLVTELVNHRTDRTVPKNYTTVGGATYAGNVLCQLSGTINGYNLSTAGVLTAYVTGYTVGTFAGVPIAWYFTPVNA